MVGNPVDGGAPEDGSPALLDGVSEAELDAFVSKLRTDKNPVIPPVAPPRSRWDVLGDRLHRGNRYSLRDAEKAREEAAGHAWYAVLDGKRTGPLELSALRERWEAGALGPDSLCWRDGFTAWQPVCRVPELAEALAPLPLDPDASVSEEDWDEITVEEDFPLKGAEALRLLVEEEEAVLALEAERAEVSNSASEPTERVPLLADDRLFAEPVALPAEPVTSEVPDVSTVLPTVAAAAPPVVMPVQVEVRWRTGLWLAVGGGLVGGMTVALVLALMGLRGSGPLAPRGDSALALGGTSPAAMSAAVSAPLALTPMALQGGSQPGAASVSGGVSVAQVGDAMAATLGSVSAPDFTLPSVQAPTMTPATPTRAPEPVRPAVSATAADMRQPAPAPSPARPAPPAAAPAREARVQELDFDEAPAKEAQASAPASKEADEVLGPDEDFARELDGPPPEHVPGTGVAKPSVWVPPAPAAREAPTTLAQSDIFAVVLANKGDVTACGSARKADAAEDGARVVVRWTILPSGQVTDVATEAGPLQGTPVAHCIEGKIRAWTFPKHAEQGPPVRFPFVF